MHQRKDGRWEEKVKSPGSKKFKSFYGATKAEVKRKMVAYTEALERGMTIDEALDKWLAYKEKKVSAKTYEGYQAPIKRIKDALGDVLCRDTTPGQVQAFVDSVAAQGFKRTAVQRPLDILRMLFNWLIIEGGGISNNPCTAVKLPSGLKQERRDLALREDVETIKNSAGLPFGLFAYLLVYSGLRKGEALALTDKDFSAGTSAFQNR